MPLDFRCRRAVGGAALGSAIHAATAAGALATSARPPSRWAANPQRLQADSENVAAYDKLYREYVAAHDWFGRGNDMMRRLRRIGSQDTNGALQ